MLEHAIKFTISSFQLGRSLNEQITISHQESFYINWSIFADPDIPDITLSCESINGSTPQATMLPVESLTRQFDSIIPTAYTTIMYNITTTINGGVETDWMFNLCSND